MSLVEQVVDDLRRESADLDAIVAGLDDAAWRTPTPAEPWTVADTVGHLLWTDRIALVATEDAEAFARHTARLSDRADDPGGAVTALAKEAAAAPPERLLADWRRGREALAEALLAHPADERLPWLGPPMSATSMATARLMETWAHGQDVADALGVRRTPTARLRHVCHLAVRARGFAFAAHGQEPPGTDVRVELTGPDGTAWTWGDPDAEDRVTGTALDFCLLAVQRIHRDDTDLVAEGALADRWLDVIQAFAGPPGEKRPPSGRR